ncbi:hypothetical protein MTR67_017605 [Solanum verrucosum]|uniref:Reverse transcriptase/retrotransposon-derived protein RNase H-like domain-containing protein n=1 Tax=Solanum verrucosum TaxID=315347 RepID=A0AAF0TSD2_SOLVR|nr:hypothetical protein MTR67_017605 [Solanum verrucosum]
MCYCRSFVEGFSSIAAPLTKLTQKMVKFQWAYECEKHFLELKTRLTTTHLWTLPDGQDDYVVCCDASRVGLGVGSMQYYYDMNVLYHPGKANVVVDALNRLSIGIVAHVEEEKKEFARDVHRLALFGLCLMDTSNDSMIV